MLKILKRFLRKGRGFQKNEGGVSEILGDILLVSVVIVVVGALAAQIVNVRAPPPTKNVDFGARIDGNDLAVTHMGGRDLNNAWTTISVDVGQSVGHNYMISDGFTGNHPKWKIGEEWRKDITSDKTMATTLGMDLHVRITDTQKNIILFDQLLISGNETKAFPDVGFQQGTLKFSNGQPNGGDPLNISALLVNFGAVDVTNIEVRFYDDTALIGINNSVLLLKKFGVSPYQKTVTLDWTTTYLGRHVISAKVVPKSNEINLANNYISAKLNVGLGVNLDFTKPDLLVTKFTINNETPISKIPVGLKVTIANIAKIQATGFTLRWGDVFQGTNTTLGTTNYVGNVTYVHSIDMGYIWIPPKGGQHHLWVHIENVLPSGEDVKADPNNNWGLMDVNVMPRILLVDDTNVGKSSPRNTITYMKEALRSIAIPYDIVAVSAGDGPQYSGTGIVLSNYDLVIWETGYESTNTLTTTGATADIVNLKNYMDNNGSLWVIGQDVANDLWSTANGKTFLKNYLHVNAQNLDVKLGVDIKGNGACPVTKGLDFNTSVPANLTATPDLITPDVNSIAAMNNATNQNISLLYNKTYKMAFFAFEFAHIKSMAERSILAYKMLIWFNITVFFNGDDLAVSEVTITPTSPHYKEEVAIKATIRNNGVHTQKNVKVVFKDLYMGIETTISPNVKDRAGTRPVYDNPMSVNITAMGGQNLTVKYWLPDKIGTHQIMVVVDPNNVIQEIDKTNNEFVSDLLSTKVMVDSITLIVDDDQVGGALPKNTTTAAINVMNMLHYKYNVYPVAAAGNNGPNLDNLTKYNNVIWCFGNESTVGTTFTSTDQTNIQTYLTGYQGNIWVIGQNFLADTGVMNNVSFRRNLLGIQGVTANKPTPTTLIGVNDNITHGMRYPAARTFGSNEADVLAPRPGAQRLFLDSGAQNFATSYQNTTGVNYKVVVMGFEYSFITDIQDREELAYMIFHWFNESDSRIELRVTQDDLYFARDNGAPQPFDAVKPVLGASYILQVKVWNVGNTPAGAIVRFLDGTTVINSASIYIPGSTVDPSGQVVLGSELAEVIWSPLFTGTRPITVKVDPDKNIPVTNDPRSTTGEIMKKNNNITRSIEVFFFYDDMENGPTNWTHEATLLRINGEAPIEYFDTLRPINTNVVDTWSSMTGNWKQLYDEGHTLPSSFKASEPADTGNFTLKLRVGFCIEDSASIKNLDPNYIRLRAALNMTKNTFSQADEVTVYKIEGSTTNLYANEWPGNTFEFYPFENVTKYLNYTKGYFDNAGGVDVKGCIRMGTTDLKNSWSTPGIYPALIVITSLQNYGGAPDITQMMDDSRQSGIPIYMIGVGAEPQLKSELLYDIAEVSNGGLYFHATTAESINSILKVIGEIIGAGGSRSMTGDQSMTGSRDGSRTSAPTTGNGNKILTLYNPVGTDKWAQGIYRNITYFCGAGFTVAQCSSPVIQFDPGTGTFTKINPVTVKNSAYDWTSDKASFDPKANCWQYNWTVPSVTCTKCRISVTINAGALNVSSVNFQIFNSGLPLGSKHNLVANNITTDSVNLANYKTAKLSFWHKYDLLTAENGGVILVGNSSQATTGFKYYYVIPVKSYTGNLRLDKTVKDDAGLRMQFAYNGRSAGQTFEWTFDEVDLSRFISASTPYVRVRFSLFYWGYGNGGGWWLDDVMVKATRSDTVAITASVDDQWQYYQWRSGIDSPFLQPHSGTHMWWNHNPTAADDLKSGIDNSLITKSISLLNAKDAYLSAYFKFNLDNAAGRPPDGFRTEISSDGGVTWRPVNLGVRSSWGVSGYWSIDGKSPDGKQAYTGIQDSGIDSNTPVWVKGDTLWRLNVNITGWSGSVVKIRFRVVTNLDPTHYDRLTTFKGLAIDDVIVRGNTTTSSAPLPRLPQGGPVQDGDGPSMVHDEGCSGGHHAQDKSVEGTHATEMTTWKDEEEA